MFLGRRKPLVGLDIGSSSVKAIELSRTRNGYEVVGSSRHSLGPDTIVDGAIADARAVTEAIKLAFVAGGFKAKQVATSVSGHSVIVKRVVLPVDNAEEIPSAIQFRSDEYIPFEFSEVNVDYEIIGPAQDDSDGIEVLLVAAKRDQISNSTTAVTMAGRKASVVDIDAFAVQNTFEVNYEPDPSEAVALLNIGASLTNINITKAGRPLFVRDVSVGGNQYTDTLQKELSLSFEEAEDLKFGKQVGMYDSEMVAPLLDSITDMLTMEIRKTFDFFRETYREETIASIYLSGGVSKSVGLAEKIQVAFGLPTEVMDPLKVVTVNPRVSSAIQHAGPDVAVALGLALRGFDE